MKLFALLKAGGGRVWRPVVWAAVLAYVVVLGVYGFFFHERARSTNPEMWAAFGDYMGGVLGPVLGLLTIVLLVQTLRQNDEALAQSREELRLTRVQLERGVEIQEKTERALEEQIAVAQRTGTYDRMISLVEHYGREAERLKAEYDKCFNTEAGSVLEGTEKAFAEPKRKEMDVADSLRAELSKLLQDRTDDVVKEFRGRF